MEETITSLDFNDEQLTILNQIVREHKVNVSNEDLVLIALGRRKSPLIDLTIKVATAWEKRKSETEVPVTPPAPVDDTAQ